MNVIYHPEARTEVIEAAQYYESKQAGLGAEFLDEIDLTVARIAGQPRGFAAIKEDVRCAIVRRFPYAVLYRLIHDEVRVLVVRHHSRRDEYGIERR